MISLGYIYIIFKVIVKWLNNDFDILATFLPSQTGANFFKQLSKIYFL